MTTFIRSHARSWIAAGVITASTIMLFWKDDYRALSLSEALVDHSSHACPAQVAFYVSSKGDDANPGTLSAPFLTIQKALNAATGLTTSGVSGNIVISLRGGNYRLKTPLNFTDSNSGQNGCKLVIRSYPGEQAIIDGGRPITGWVLHDSRKNIYRAYIGKGARLRQLYVNGRPAERARMYLEAGHLSRTSAGFAVKPGTIIDWTIVTAAEVVMHGKWMTVQCPIASASKSLIIIAEPCWRNAQWAVPWGAIIPSWIENAYRPPDRAGEWYYDRTAGYLYYIPRSGENISRDEVFAPVLDTILFGNLAHDITFEDLQFTHSNWTEPDRLDGYVGLQAGYHKVGTNGSLVPMHSPIQFLRSWNITFQRNTFTQLGSTALAFRDNSHDVYILKNRFDEIAGGAMQFGQIDDGGEIDVGRQNRSYIIRDNTIKNVGFDYDTAAIAAFYTADLIAEHNEIGLVPHVGISIGWGWGKNPSYSRNNRIAWNYIHDFSLVFSDSAAIYTLGPSPGTVIRDNYISGGGRGYGCLYPDEGSAYQRWTRNVCENVREWLHLWTSSIHDNRIDGNWTNTQDLENNGNNNDVSDNIYVSDGHWPATAIQVKTEAGPSEVHPEGVAQ